MNEHGEYVLTSQQLFNLYIAFIKAQGAEPDNEDVKRGLECATNELKERNLTQWAIDLLEAEKARRQNHGGPTPIPEVRAMMFE